MFKLGLAALGCASSAVGIDVIGKIFGGGKNPIQIQNFGKNLYVLSQSKPARAKGGKKLKDQAMLQWSEADVDTLSGLVPHVQISSADSVDTKLNKIMQAIVKELNDQGREIEPLGKAVMTSKKFAQFFGDANATASASSTKTTNPVRQVEQGDNGGQWSSQTKHLKELTDGKIHLNHMLGMWKLEQTRDDAAFDHNNSLGRKVKNPDSVFIKVEDYEIDDLVDALPTYVDFNGIYSDQKRAQVVMDALVKHLNVEQAELIVWANFVKAQDKPNMSVDDVVLHLNRGNFRLTAEEREAERIKKEQTDKFKPGKDFNIHKNSVPNPNKPRASEEDFEGAPVSREQLAMLSDYAKTQFVNVKTGKHTLPILMPRFKHLFSFETYLNVLNPNVVPEETGSTKISCGGKMILRSGNNWECSHPGCQHNKDPRIRPFHFKCNSCGTTLCFNHGMQHHKNRYDAWNNAIWKIEVSKHKAAKNMFVFKQQHYTWNQQAQKWDRDDQDMCVHFKNTDLAELKQVKPTVDVSEMPVEDAIAKLVKAVVKDMNRAARKIAPLSKKGNVQPSMFIDWCMSVDGRVAANTQKIQQKEQGNNGEWDSQTVRLKDLTDGKIHLSPIGNGRALYKLEQSRAEAAIDNDNSLGRGVRNPDATIITINANAIETDIAILKDVGGLDVTVSPSASPMEQVETLLQGVVDVCNQHDATIVQWGKVPFSVTQLAQHLKDGNLYQTDEQKEAERVKKQAQLDERRRKEGAAAAPAREENLNVSSSVEQPAQAVMPIAAASRPQTQTNSSSHVYAQNTHVSSSSPVVNNNAVVQQAPKPDEYAQVLYTYPANDPNAFSANENDYLVITDWAPAQDWVLAYPYTGSSDHPAAKFFPRNYVKKYEPLSQSQQYRTAAHLNQQRQYDQLNQQYQWN